MADSTKIQLSEKEMGLVVNSDWILTKHTIMKKVYDLFGQLLIEMKSDFSKNQANTFKDILENGKISKGENYKLLPYVMLDYPRQFSKHDVYAIRTLFWWGNFFSITLHIKGKYKTRITKDTAGLFDYLKQNKFYICVSDDEWQHDFEPGNFVQTAELSLLDFEDILARDFLRISKKIPLSEWDSAFEFLKSVFKELVVNKFLNCPIDETGL